MESTLRLPHSVSISTFARAGYFARGVVYLLMGGLAFLLAMGKSGGTATDSKGTLRQLLTQPFGKVFLFLLALGLFSYAIWRFYQAAKDTEHWGKGAKAIMKRIGTAIGGAAYFSLGVYAIRLIFALSPKATSEEGAAHTVLTLPFGRFLIGAFGLGVIAYGVAEVIAAIKEKFCKHVSYPQDKKDKLVPLSKFGLIARAVVFGMIGTFFVQSALNYDSKEAGGFTQAWNVLRELPYGNTLLAIAAAGFIAFGIFGITEALYARVPADKVRLR